jgi:ElaB/YqjD/DUF883 family membrane-anchored ribosome-binding protein
MATTAQLEQEVDQTRGRIEDTLEQLRRRLRPGSLVEDALGFASENGGGELVRSLGQQVSANPLPVALMGVGLAWLMISQNRSGAGARQDSLNRSGKRTEAMTNYDQDRRTGMDDSKSSRGMMDNARERASDMMGRARDTTSGAYDKVSRSVSSAAGSISSAMPNTRSISTFMQEEPMVLAGLGIALGAIVGAMLPSTEIEERYLGPVADTAKQQATDVAREQWERGKQMAAEGWEEAKDAAQRTWEDAKGEAQQSWENTQKRVAQSDSGQTGDMTGTQSPLVPGQEDTRERIK